MGQCWLVLGVWYVCRQQVGSIIQFCSLGKQFQIDSMRQASTSVSMTSYLDVSQFILKEASPLIKPSSPSHHHSHQTPKTQETPEIEPIDHDPSLFMLTPLNGALPQPQIHDLLDDFVLDAPANEQKTTNRRHKSRREPRFCLALPMFRLDCELERIVEDDEEASEVNSDLSSESGSEVEQDEEDQGNTISSYHFNHWAMRVKSKDYSLRDTEEEQQSTIDISIVDYSETIARFNKNPKAEILKKMREVEAMEIDEDERRTLIKKFLQKYLLDYESHCFEEAWKELNQEITTTIKTLAAGLEETFSKRIGCLPFENRRVKLLKYLQKKKRRIWRKKVSYDCRKKVADGRLRIKGKFVTREQACEQLGLESLDNYSAQQIKEMLQRRIDESLAQQMVC